jgi:hypothetical protein
MLSYAHSKAAKFGNIVPSIGYVQLQGELREIRATGNGPISVLDFSQKIFMDNPHLEIKQIFLRQIASLNFDGLFGSDDLLPSGIVLPFKQDERVAWLRGRPMRDAMGIENHPLGLGIPAIPEKKIYSDNFLFLLRTWEIPDATRGLIYPFGEMGDDAGKIDNWPLFRAHLVQLPTHNPGLSVKGRDGGVGLAKSGKRVGMLLVSRNATLVNLPPREPSNNKSSRGKSASNDRQNFRPFNQLAFGEGLVALLVGLGFMILAWWALFFWGERRHGIAIVIFSFVPSLVCITDGTLLISVMT